MVSPAPQRPVEAVEELDFDELFRRFAPYVARIGWRLLGRDDEVDDLIQDVFTNAHRKRGQLLDPGPAPRAALR